MKKNKKNKAAKKPTLLGGAAKSLKKLGKGTANRIGSLSTTKKVLGGAALVALSLSFFSKRRGAVLESTNSPIDAAGAEDNLAAMADDAG